MKIYHYTTMESLALILKHKTIRFTRSDKVDDLEEGAAESLGVRLGKYTFISCWTEDSEESIPLWKMYTGSVNGVRIALEKDGLFKRYLVPERNPYGMTNLTGGPMYLDFPPQEYLGQSEYSIMPIFNRSESKSSGFYREVQYVDDVSEKTKNAIRQIPPGPDNNYQGGTFISLDTVGSFKNKRWAFEKESRFVLTIYPVNINRMVNGDFHIQEMLHALAENRLLSFTHYDKELRDGAFDDLEITLSPMATDSQRTIVEALCHQYAPNAVIKESDLYKKVNLK